MTVERVHERDLDELLPLMRGYCDFYRASPSDDDLLAMARAHLLPLVRETNPLIAQLAGQRSLPLLDLYSAMVDDTDQLREEYTYDGVHLSEEGYAAWIRVLEAAP